MAHQKDQVVSMPKAFVFYEGEAHFEASPINDNHFEHKKTWILKALFIGLGLYMLYLFL